MIQAMGMLVKDPLDSQQKLSESTEAIQFKSGKQAKNAFAVAALTNGASNADGTLSDAELKWLTRRAKGGFGIIHSCATHVQKIGQGWAGEWGIFDDKHTAGWRRAATALHEHGALF